MVARVVNFANVVSDVKCPGALHAVPARDGLLARIRLPGGLLTVAQAHALATAAARYADGHLDITARASVQLRGIAPEALEGLAGVLERAGLLPSAEHDRVRNILAGAFAGSDASELIDTRPFVRALDAALIADAALAALPAKFAFGFDGGGRGGDFARADLALHAVLAPRGVRFHLVFDGRPTGYGAAPEDAVEVLLVAARTALGVAEHSTRAGRGWRLGTLAAAPAAIVAALARRLALCPSPPARERAAAPPLGLLPGATADAVNAVPCVPLGRLDAAQLHGLAALASRSGAELRLAPWRGVVLCGVPVERCAEVAAALAELRLTLDGSDGFNGIAACAGSVGCSASLADVRRDAAMLARRVAERSTRGFSWNVHLAGCEKRCAMRGAASVALVATARGYEVSIEGAPARHAPDGETALALALSARVARERRS